MRDQAARRADRQLVETAFREAKACGVTRLANVTGLDVLGVHVFQAVRPWGRSLSVHQGKGLTQEAARIGALMEAIESDHAEVFDLEQRICAFEDIASSERAPTILDFASDRRDPFDVSQSLAWVAAETPGRDHRLWVPFDAVCVDYSRAGDQRVHRSSDGLGARFDHEGACLKALLEVIERDAEWAWRASPLEVRSRAQVEEESISCPWFEILLSTARSHGMRISICKLPVVVPLAMFHCEIFERGAGPRRSAGGTGCGFSAEEALLAAVLEAAQSRLTIISGVRDDLPPVDPTVRPAIGLILPPSVDDRPHPWDEIVGGQAWTFAATSEGLAEALAAAGYPDIGLVDLSRPGRDVHVVKALVPGLGASARARRPALQGAAA